MTSTPKRSIAWFAALALLAGAARAQDDTALFGNNVPPNVMIIFDNSGSMAHGMWDTSFNQELFYDSAAIYSDALKDCNTGSFNLASVAEIANSAGQCPGSGDADGDANADECPESEWQYMTSGSRFRCRNIPNGCAAAPAGWACSVSTGARYTFTLPDITAGSGGTRWSVNYIHFVTNQMYATGAPPVIPTQDRMDTAETAIVDVVNNVNPTGFAEAVRFGVGTFGANAVGGTVLANIAAGNKATVISQVQALTPSGNTPLAESTVSMVQYMTGLGSTGNCSGSTTLNASNPMQDWCRKNFIVMVTDGEPVDDDFTDMAGGKAGFTCAIGNADADLNEEDETGTHPTLCPTPADCADAGRTDRPPYRNAGSPGGAGTDWFDDVTTYCYQTDLRPDLSATQNIVTYTIGLLIDHPLLVEAATQAGGTFFVANSAQELSDTLTATVLEIIARSTAFSAATVPSSRTAFSDGMFVASFIPRSAYGNWEGHLEAYRITPDLEVVGINNQPSIDSTGTFIEPKNYFWDSATAVKNQAARTLYANVSGARSDFTDATTTYATFGIAAGSPSPEWNTYPYDLAGPSKTDEELADDLVSYVYGFDAYDQDRDADSAEVRDYVLGDLFHSNPIVIGPPPFALSEEDGYGPLETLGTFLEKYHQRKRRLYVGGNDAALHAIDTGSFNTGDNLLTPETENGYYSLGSGEEVFGWVPGSLLDTVKYFPRNAPRTYYYVDGSPSAADTWFPSSASDVSKEAAEWATLLVTGMRQGGRSYLALDVTDPDAGATDAHGPYPVFQWEFDDPSEPMGETWSEPIITRVKMRAASGTGDQCGANNGDGDCIERWVVIVAGGYDDTGDPNLPGWIDDPSDPSWTEYGKALFVLDAQTGDVLGKLERDALDSQLQNMTYVLPSTAGVLDLNFDGFADSVYVGDTGGQVWKWVIHEVGEDTDSDGLVDTWPGGRFFDAGSAMVSGVEHFRSIFAPPSAAFVDGDLILAFGTGERTNMSYAGDPSVDDNNRLYVIEDPDPLGTGAIPSSPYDEGDLTDVTSLASDNNSADMGYFIKGLEGEKFVTSHIIVGGVLITASFVPPAATDPVCEQSGSSYAFVFNLASGSGQHTDPDADSQARRLYAAVGVPSDPRVTISSATGDVQLFLKGSSGQMLSMDAPGISNEPVELVYWRQRF
jgi:type IV pilus assembly protein PilY1